MEEIKKLTGRKSKPSKTKLSEYDWDMLEHKRVINQSPPEKLLKKNEQYGNKFLPLQIVEQMLLALYDHYEVTIPFQPQYIEGQLLYHVTLTVHHPISKQKLSYSGTASVPLIPASGDFKWNHRNIPGAESFAILNAAKKIGQIFRAEHDDHSDVMKDYFEKKQISSIDSALENEKRRMLKLIPTIKTKGALTGLLGSVKKINDSEVTALFNAKMEILKK